MGVRRSARAARLNAAQGQVLRFPIAGPAREPRVRLLPRPLGISGRRRPAAGDLGKARNIDNGQPIRPPDVRAHRSRLRRDVGIAPATGFV